MTDTQKKTRMTVESEGTKIAGISKDISYIQRDISEIKEAMRTSFATKDALAQTAKDTEIRLTRLEGQSNLWRFLNPTFSAILGSVLTFLLVQYIMTLH